ncbi:MAG: NADH:ubiquinone oxidoreductase [Cyanobacteria bacterium QS_8_64_29]|nr:MAG: NADH:ubiquinone oxidoreductase [Cyanobacteria bacterium QS_8_64_29]
MCRLASWDMGRFVRTLAYFGAIPLLDKLPGLKPTEETPRPQPATPASQQRSGTILVAGATGGVGQRVVQQLRERGYPVRGLVRSIERARPLLGEQLDLYEGDITVAESLQPSLMQGVTAVICCTGTRVQPVEGDTPDRQKYYQGVTYYDPEIAASTPETVEYRGTSNLAALAAQQVRAPGARMLFDFCAPSAQEQAAWGALDDAVMGGVSESSFSMAGDSAVFAGNVSTENNGGFASVRTRNFDPPLDLSDCDGVRLRVKGDGKRYKFFLRSDSRWDGIGYGYSFDTVPDRWIDVEIPFKAVTPTFRARTREDAAPFDPGQLHSLQLMLSKFEFDRELNPTFEPGPFALQVATIEAYRDWPGSQFVMVSSAGVTRPERADLDWEQQPPAVRMNEQLGGILSWKRRAEGSVRQSGLPYTILRPCALTEASGGKPLQLAQGDEITGQVSRDAIAELCVQAIAEPQARNKTVEVREAPAGGRGTAAWQDLQPDPSV